MTAKMITNKTKKTCLKTCLMCQAPDVKIGKCGYCRDDCCELCARPDGFDCGDKCCYVCWTMVKIPADENCGCLICDGPRIENASGFEDAELCIGCNATYRWDRYKKGYVLRHYEIIPRNRRTTIPAVPTGRKFIITLKGGKIVKKTEI